MSGICYERCLEVSNESSYRTCDPFPNDWSDCEISITLATDPKTATVRRGPQLGYALTQVTPCRWVLILGSMLSIETNNWLLEPIPLTVQFWFGLDRYEKIIDKIKWSFNLFNSQSVFRMKGELAYVYRELKGTVTLFRTCNRTVGPISPMIVINHFRYKWRRNTWTQMDEYYGGYGVKPMDQSVDWHHLLSTVIPVESSNKCLSLIVVQLNGQRIIDTCPTFSHIWHIISQNYLT